MHFRKEGWWGVFVRKAMTNLDSVLKSKDKLWYKTKARGSIPRSNRIT